MYLDVLTDTKKNHIYIYYLAIHTITTKIYLLIKCNNFNIDVVNTFQPKYSNVTLILKQVFVARVIIVSSSELYFYFKSSSTTIFLIQF